MLPPVAIHMVSTVSRKGSKKLVRGAYATGIMFALALAFSTNAFDSFACASNYAIFHLTFPVNYLYGVYYYGWLFTGIAMCLKFRKGATRKIHEALTLQAFGYISFLLPTGIVILLNPTTMNGIPSIMCGFAIIYALILAFGIAPRVLKQKPLPEILSTR
jgi:hypothetical protein